MAAINVSIHLRSEDKPFLQRLDGGSIAVWLEGQHVGPTIIDASGVALLKLRDAIDAFLAPVEQSEAA